MTITITEAIAEIKTINKRLEKKRQYITGFLARPEKMKDPLEKHGGSQAEITKEQQAIKDLQERIVKLRRGVQRASDSTMVTVQGETKSMSEWLVWRREVAPQHQQFLGTLRQALTNIRARAQREGATVVSGVAAVVDSRESKDTDVVVNIDEKKLADEIENTETILGELDGVLSLKNATVHIEEIE